MLRITTALFLLAPVAAAAQCLTPADLDRGITVEYGNGNISHIERGDGGILVDAYDERDSYYKQTIIFESQDGVFPLGWSTYEEGRWNKQRGGTISYGFTPATAASFGVGATGLGTITVSDVGYFDGDKTFSWRVYESEPLTIGDCSYEALRVFTTISNLPRGDLYVNEIKYLPELGIGLQLGNSYFGFSPDNSIVTGLTAG